MRQERQTQQRLLAVLTLEATVDRVPGSTLVRNGSSFSHVNQLPTSLTVLSEQGIKTVGTVRFTDVSRFTDGMHDVLQSSQWSTTGATGETPDVIHSTLCLRALLVNDH